MSFDHNYAAAEAVSADANCFKLDLHCEITFS